MLNWIYYGLNKKQTKYIQLFIMQLQRAEQVASNAIDAIVTKGTQKLYENYIKQKIPNHTFQQASQLVQRNFGLFFQQTFESGVIAKDKNPSGGFNDTIVPFKVQKGDRFRQTLHDRNTNQTFITVNKKAEKESGRSTMIQSERTDRNSASIKIRQQNIIKPKPLKGMSLNPEQVLENESTLRRQREQNKREALKNQKEGQKIQKQKKMNKIVLQTKIKQLQKHGVPYYYNNEGQIQSPNIADFKCQTFQNDKLKRRNRITSLHCQTLQLSFAQRYLKDVRFLIGRKKGYFSTERNKKLKMTNEEFNNDNDRQCSTIPYLALVQGVKVIERQRNIMAEKSRRPSLQLSQYKQKSNETMFKSFVSDYQTIQATNRPFTTQFERSNKPGGVKGRESLLWKPQTASKGCRLNINNQQLAKSVIE